MHTECNLLPAPGEGVRAAALSPHPCHIPRCSLCARFVTMPGRQCDAQCACCYPTVTTPIPSPARQESILAWKAGFSAPRPSALPLLGQQILANPALYIWSLGTVLPACPHFSISSANLGPLRKAAAWLPSRISIWLLSMGIWTLTTALIPCLSFNKRPASPLTPQLEAVGPHALRASSRGNLVSHPSCQPGSSGTHMFENRSSSSSPIHCFSPSFALLNIDFLLHY